MRYPPGPAWKGHVRNPAVVWDLGPAGRNSSGPARDGHSEKTREFRCPPDGRILSGHVRDRHLEKTREYRCPYLPRGSSLVPQGTGSQRRHGNTGAHTCQEDPLWSRKGRAFGEDTGIQVPIPAKRILSGHVREGLLGRSPGVRVQGIGRIPPEQYRDRSPSRKAGHPDGNNSPGSGYGSAAGSCGMIRIVSTPSALSRRTDTPWCQVNGFSRGANPPRHLQDKTRCALP